MTSPVVIAAFRSHAEAAAARVALEDASIAAEVRNRTDAIPRLCVDAFEEGFDVVVDASDAEAALRLLQRLWPDDAPPPHPVERCPACGATTVSRLPRLRLFIATAALLLVIGEITGLRELFLLVIGIIAVLLLIAPGRRCRTCGERWRGGGAPPAAENAVEGEVPSCPRCGSDESETISRRRENALTLLVAFAIPPTILVWPFKPRHRCTICRHEWR